MKMGRKEDKVMGPMFPRLHVNDADKGGPRAPPRNKMALYELFSIPSQKFGSDAGSTAAFSSQGRGHERSVSSLFCTPQTSLRVAEKVRSHSVEKINQNAMSMGLERNSLKHSSQRMANPAGNVREDVECRSLRPDELSGLKGSIGKKSGDEDDFRVPTCVQPGIILHSDKDHRSMDRERSHLQFKSPQKSEGAIFNSQSQVQNSHGMPLERNSSSSLMPRQHESNGKSKTKDSVAHRWRKEDSISHPEKREKAADPSIMHKLSLSKEHPSCKLNELKSSEGGSARRCQESNGSFGEARCLTDAEFMENQVISRSGSCSKMSLSKGIVEPSVVEHFNAAGEKVAGEEHAERMSSPDDANKIGPSVDANRDETPEDADRSDDVSKTSILDSIPGVDICPDDVVGLIGPKHFWKARRAIANQQRVFAVQVFELHRLIKVQKLIAASPQLLLEGTHLHSSPKDLVKDPSASILSRPHLQIKQKDDSHKMNNSECATEKTESANFLANPRVQIVNQKDESLQSICNRECHTENTGDNLALPHEHGKASQLPWDGADVPSFPATSDNKSGAWCFHPPGNQWLIPVMSPSEGLIYKPYTGPYPPNAAFMAPVYGGCGPSVPPMADPVKSAFGVPVSHQQQNMGVFPDAPAITPNYFPAPYVLPAVNPLFSNSPVDHVRPMAAPPPRPNAQLEQHSWSSCNMSNPKKGGISERAKKVQTSEDNVQGSTANCPGNRSQAPAECSGRSQSHCRDQQMAGVIRVVPHNRRSATESAARIFRSIQKERQQHDSV